MKSHATFTRIRSIFAAITVTFAINFAISEITESPTGRLVAAETGGVEMPVPPRPAPSAVDGGVEMPVPPRP